MVCFCKIILPANRTQLNVYKCLQNVFFLLWLTAASANAQLDTLPLHTNEEDLIETFLQEQENDTDFDYNDLFEELEHLRSKPLSLNHLTEDQLALFPFLTPIQKTALLEYIRDFGPLVAVYELQAVPYFDLPTIRRLLPFVELGQPTIEPISKKWSSEGKHQLILRWSRTLEEKRGFIKDETGLSPYAGDGNAFYLRYRFAYTNRLSFGLTAEKDAGETFFKGSNKNGFDFYSAHFFLHNPNSRLRSLALGDYSASMGQGLILFSGFSSRKSPLTTRIKRVAPPIRRYSSVNETDFFRGAAATLALTDQLLLTSFFSSKKQDANISLPNDDPDDDPLGLFATSLQTSGKHRTEAEIADEKVLQQTTLGTTLKWKARRWHVAINSLYNHLEHRIERRPLLYNQFFFNGNRLFNLSFDYSLSWHNFHFFGETATSQWKSIATINGVVATLDTKMDLALLHRHFPRNYQALNARPFAETSGARNESGLYLGMEIRPARQWTLNAYFDQWQHPWLRFRADAPGTGSEWLMRLTFKIRHKLEAHLQVKNERKPENQDTRDARYDQLFERQNFQARLHLSYHLSKDVQWRSRLYAGFTEINRERLTGTALYQDLKYQPPGAPFSFSARFAIFDTGGYTIRFYAYENDVLNSFTVPAYSDRGNRFYLLMSYRTPQGILVQGRIGKSTFVNRKSTGSGHEEINGPTKTEVKMQIRWNF